MGKAAKKKATGMPDLESLKKDRVAQQTLPITPQPLQIVRSLVGLYASLMLIMLCLGAWLRLGADEIIQFPIRKNDAGAAIGVGQRYSDVWQCIPPRNNCTVEFTIDEDVKKGDKGIMLYYELTPYFQNHRRYTNSKSGDQMRGQVVTSFKSLENCQPRLCEPFCETEVDPQQYLNPCGLIADPNTRFSDRFHLWKEADSTDENAFETEGVGWVVDIPFTDQGITYDQDEDRFCGTDECKERMSEDISSPDFRVWAHTAVTSHFRKNYRRIETDLGKGKYHMHIDINMDSDNIFNGDKYFGFTTLGRLGGKNDFLAWLCLVLAFLLFLSICAITVSLKMRNMDKIMQQLLERQQAAADAQTADTAEVQLSFEEEEEVTVKGEQGMKSETVSTPPSNKKKKKVKTTPPQPSVEMMEVPSR